MNDIGARFVEAMQAKGVSRQVMAKRMGTSRSHLARLFDPNNDRVQIDTIQKAAEALGLRVNITFEDAGPVDPGPRRGRPADTYTMWLCYFLASNLVGDAIFNAEFLSQHKDREGKPGSTKGGYVVVGKHLGMSADAVERQVSNARKRLATKKGPGEFLEWMDEREEQWWFYQAICVEKRKLKLLEYVGEMEGDTLVLTRGELHYTPKEVDAIVAKAQKRYEEKKGGGQYDYENWRTVYERRDEKARFAPSKRVPTSPANAIATDQARVLKGLRTGLTKAGRPWHGFHRAL